MVCVWRVGRGVREGWGLGGRGVITSFSSTIIKYLSLSTAGRRVAPIPPLVLVTHHSIHHHAAAPAAPSLRRTVIVPITDRSPPLQAIGLVQAWVGQNVTF